ncbi:hypothetical protein MTCOM_15780 [Moorella thermoacetica]
MNKKRSRKQFPMENEKKLREHHPIKQTPVREPVNKPLCPFCGLPIAKPRELAPHRPGEMPVGSCSCGAVYACDVTGHNLGAAFIEALVFGCNQDWDLAWGLLPEEDYLERLVEHYDYDSHLIVPEGFYEGRRVTGALYFVRLQADIREVTGPGVQRKLREAATPGADRPGDWHPAGARKYSKREITQLVKEYHFETLVDIARQDRRVLGDLQRLLCSGDALLRLQAADILGRAAAVYATGAPEIIANLLQRLLASVSDPGAASWGAVDAMGEIIANAPATFAGYIPQLYPFLEDKTLRPRVLRALGRIAGVKPGLLQRAALHFLTFLRDPDPETRGYAAWLLGILRTEAAREDLKGLLDDRQVVAVYHNGAIDEKTVGELAAAALDRLAGA